VPIEDLIAGVGVGGPERPALRTQAPPAAAKPELQREREALAQKEREPFRRAEPVASRPPAPMDSQAPQAGTTVAQSRPVASMSPAAPKPAAIDATPAGPAKAWGLKDALLAEIRKSKMVFYSTVCAQAQ